ncbi:MAG: enoyl-ACP reductase [Alphaproteobacteria bacterium]|jgi:enoyl-[acyl-carrier protein] reductase I|nr:enoyl-ACP reductase [Alphaproteobacteria bacterium]MBT4848550.1 enoyl-ACP reductase [Alphaproteobacteria bacterium]MBT5256932.1 enoyl-ACP reductase [Alphaproteobacteria bacterium]MBT5481921.1 enoyl-ACP reductase [Alphaproteobacteria bacterium]MBT5729828.1 enoyl-ACP reductase [Alphaproteobacteria bacterium]|tara:strand:- start:2009 stop:2794 length:786 start_codon:yes stop_codon:yes gene_type:complete
MGILSGKRGLIMGVANERSAAWGIAAAAASHGAELAFTYQIEGFRKRLEPLAASIGSSLLIECDVAEDGAIAKSFAELSTSWDSLDFVVHAIGFSDKSELKGAYYNTSRQNFADTMLVSAFSFTEVAAAARKMMPNGGSLLTMSYLGGVRTSPNYNVMGVAKAALEASTRYLAVDLGGENIRVNTLSAGPMRTLAGSAITGARHIFRHSEKHAPLGRNPDIEEVGRAGVYLLSDLSSGVTGELHYVDGGYHHIGVPSEDVE